MPEAPIERRSPRLLGLFFIFAGAMHFALPKFYERIMPDYLPAHRELVLLSGVAEAAGGVATLHPRSRRLAGSWLVLTMIAVFPANVYAATDFDKLDLGVPRWTLWARLPLQLMFIRWILAATRPAAA
jgi:uncharacterized membrane protein